MAGPTTLQSQTFMASTLGQDGSEAIVPNKRASTAAHQIRSYFPGRQLTRHSSDSQNY
jgi:hypothetical protein